MVYYIWINVFRCSIYCYNNGKTTQRTKLKPHKKIMIMKQYTMLIHYNNIIAYHNNYLYTTNNGIIDTNTTGITIDSSPIGIGSRFKKWCEDKGIVLFYVRK